MCLLDLKTAFDRVPGNVLEWAMKNKGMPNVLVRSVMSLYDCMEQRQESEQVLRCQRSLRLKLECTKKS